MSPSGWTSVLQIRCASQVSGGGREGIAIVLQPVKQVALDGLTSRGDINAKNLGGVLAKDLVLHLGCQLRVPVLRTELFGYCEGLERVDLPVRRSDYRSVGTPQNVIGAEAVEQIADEDGVSRWVRTHHPRQRA